MELSLVWGELGKEYYDNTPKINAKADISLLI